MAKEVSRRTFIRQSSHASAALFAGGYLATSRGYAANESLNIACIGTGGRCSVLMDTLKQFPGVNLMAVCDVWTKHISRGLKSSHEGAVSTQFYEELLSRKDIDAVVIATSDHWHVPITIDACDAGKDVYVEKPLTHSLEEGERVIEAQKRTQRIVQVGMQQRSMTHLIEAKKLFEKKALGEVCKVHLTWNRNHERSPKPSYNINPDSINWKRFLGSAPTQPFDEYRYRNWRWFWDFGGGIFTDLMVHYLDVANWFLDLGTPSTATSIGNHFNKEGIWETPDTVQTLLQYDSPKTQVYFEGTFSNARNAAMMEYMGTKATLYADRGRYELHPERNSDVEYQELVLGERPKGSDFFKKPNGTLLHMDNWLECIRTRKEPNAPVKAGVQAAATAHLANKALREEKVIRS